ncbi:unnamed protein product, partial [Ectocarpus sp. 8 AP-2014]
HYQLGPTPLVLLWKDASVARYLGIQSDQAVVLKVGDRSSAESEERELSRGGETDAGSADHSNINPRTVSLLDGPHKGAFAAAGTGGDQRDGGGGGGCTAKYPLITADGVCVGEVGAEGSPTYVPQAKANDLLRFKLTGAEEELLDQSAGDTAAMEAAA